VELYVECASKDASSEKWIIIAEIFNAANDQLAELLAGGGNPNFQRPRDGSTALMIAASNGDLAVEKAMLENKSMNVQAFNGSSKTALILAIGAGKEEVVELLFGHGAISDVLGFEGVLEVSKKHDGRIDY